uniref:C2H2-type domain-containing protein n=1 Tax=Ornithorhynchus anatinus TaxID=9258 RepID=A0A6I8NNX8_ORNAN
VPHQARGLAHRRAEVPVHLLLGDLRHLLQPQDPPTRLPRHQPGLPGQREDPQRRLQAQGQHPQALPPAAHAGPEAALQDVQPGRGAPAGRPLRPGAPGPGGRPAASAAAPRPGAAARARGRPVRHHLRPAGPVGHRAQRDPGRGGGGARGGHPGPRPAGGPGRLGHRLQLPPTAAQEAGVPAPRGAGGGDDDGGGGGGDDRGGAGAQGPRRPPRPHPHLHGQAGGRGAGEGRGGAGGGGAPGGSGGPPPLCQITVRIGEEAIVTRRISETDLRPGETRDGGGDGESEDEESEREAGGDGDELWRPYYSYKPKRRGCGGGPPKVRRAPRGWRRKPERRPATGWGDDGAGAEAGAGGEASPAGRAGDWKHQCGVCGKSFSALKKLRKHQEAHGGAQAARAGRRPSARFACPHCAKVCKTAAALGRHAQRHAGERAPPGGGGGAPTAVIAYTKGPGGGASGARGPGPGPGQGPGVKEEEAPQEMHVSSSSGEAGQGEAAAGEAASLQDPVISGGEEPAGYPPQEFPLPLVGPRARREGCAAAAAEKGGGGGYPSAIQFGGAGDGEAGPKVAFYPEPYPLVYGPQLLAAYPYNFGNLAALPVALNMVLPDEKGGALPFLPGVFGYAVNPRAAPTPPPAAPQPAPLPPPGRPGGEGAGAGGRSEAGRGM